MRGKLLWAAGLAAGAGAAYAAARSAWLAQRRISLDGRTAIVTGGSRGLGLLIARELLWRGARVAICARSAEELDEARRWLGGGSDVLSVACDVGDPEAVGRLVAAVSERLGPVDVLVDDLATESLEGGRGCAAAVLPTMRRRGFGRICNLTPDRRDDEVARHSKALAAELTGSGVMVSTAVVGRAQPGSGLARPLSMDPERAASKIVDAIEVGLSIRLPRLAAGRGAEAQAPVRGASFVSRPTTHGDRAAARFQSPTK